ncbi:MAG: CCA tRNA nucleotidyltransferase [Candidatus ainarchaeum sp.]|jgi:tRNA nucleotidyltransferase (CCA-adding enzyme)|nr:CCA tRNA nucleotidyltransferase [Candidatus ainarchaeum sp.]MDD3085519.1 CCA tRNA nucleotidyltransferase [Candidatus ainarchaeum sp.]MDD4128136.1 CCA tRNA nucleotidyltransferase [Candidatus ainarchaeum sp.]HPM85970.1 CCA tRNA nucleotidyltransferase [archaeon]
MKKILSIVLKKITPTKKEIILEQKMVEKIRKKLLKIKGKHSYLEWCGSSARGTHLCKDRDLDLFIMFNKELSEEELEKEGLKTAKKLFKGSKWEKAYSQHPYLRGEIDGFEIEIVPSYIVKSGAEKKSAVDRTPLHNKFLLEKMSENQKKDARLLKQFLKGIGAYGADLKNCSLPGYGVELLVLYYSSFKKAIKGISEMKPGHIINITKKINEEEIKNIFKNQKFPLIIIDPVDEKRNVASALSEEQFQRMIHASKKFLKNPNIKFFFPKKIIPLPIKKIKELLEQRELIAVKMPFLENELPDIFWGQLRREEKKLKTQLEENDFKVTRSTTWSNEKEVFILFELETLTLQKSKKIFGPKASDEENSKKFLDKKRKIISGPRIEDERLILEIEREYTKAKIFLEKEIKKETKTEKKTIKKSLKKAIVLEEKEILKEYKKDFAKYLTQYLIGKERFE